MLRWQMTQEAHDYFRYMKEVQDVCEMIKHLWFDIYTSDRGSAHKFKTYLLKAVISWDNERQREERARRNNDTVSK